MFSLSKLYATIVKLRTIIFYAKQLKSNKLFILSNIIFKVYGVLKITTITMHLINGKKTMLLINLSHSPVAAAVVVTVVSVVVEKMVVLVEIIPSPQPFATPDTVPSCRLRLPLVFLQ